MPPATRRRVLASLTALAVLPACRGASPDDDAAPAGDDDSAPPARPEPSVLDAPFRARGAPPGTEDSVAFAWGLQVGDVATGSALFAVRTTEPEVLLRVSRSPSAAEDWVELGPADPIATDGEVARAELTGLQPDTEYEFAFASTDGKRRTPVGRFRTAPDEDATPVVTFGATSCLGTGVPLPNLGFLAAEQADFFLLLGDTVYADGSETLDGYRAFWRQVQQQPGFLALGASTSFVATWDDHEVYDNWSWNHAGIAQIYAAALQAYRESIPQRGGPGAGPSIWRQFSWGRTLDLFVLDCRSERRDGLFISREQMDWLKKGLTASQARFKIVATSVPVTDLSRPYGSLLASDRWQGYPEQRDELLRHVVEGGIPGVLFVTGDVHTGAIATVDPPGGPAAGLYEVFTGPAGSYLNMTMGSYPPDDQFQYVLAAQSSCLLTCDPVAGTVTVRFVDDTGAVRHERMLMP